MFGIILDLVTGQYDEDFELAEEDCKEEEDLREEEEDVEEENEPQVTAVESKNNSSLQELQVLIEWYARILKCYTHNNW